MFESVIGWNKLYIKINSKLCIFIKEIIKLKMRKWLNLYIKYMIN